MTASAKPTPIVLFPPSSLEELSIALERTDNHSTFFNRDLCVLSKNVHAPQEVLLAKIINIFLFSVKTTPLPQLKHFESAFSLYCHKLNRSHSPRYQHLTNSAEELIKTELSLKHAGKESHEANLLLITGEDRDADGCMSIRVVESLLSNIPVILSYEQLLETLQGSLELDPQSAPDRKKYLTDLNEVIQKISDPTQYGIYKHKGSSLVVLLPSNNHSFLDLRDYNLIDFTSVFHHVRLVKAGIPFEEMYHQSPQDLIPHIIQTLSTDASKHIIWAGHGSLGSIAFGLPLNRIHEILDQVRNVRCWALHSCYLLGNIRKILSLTRTPLPLILVNNGAVDTSHPLQEDASVLAYFKLFSTADPRNTTVVSKASPWLNGFSTPNHPHLVLEGSIIPATLPGISATLKQEDLLTHPLSFHDIERLYISTPHISPPLRLSKNICVLPGLAEVNTHYLFNELHTPHSLEDFINTAFLNKTYTRPGNHEDEEQHFRFTHHGHLLFMIKNLHCGWLRHYRGVIHISPGNHNFFYKDHQWCNVQDYSPVDIIPILIKALHESRPRFVKEGFDSAFYHDIEAAFHLPEGCLRFDDTKSQKSPQPPPVEESAKPSEKNPIEQQFKLAVINQDIEAISRLYSQISQGPIITGFDLCISTNLDRSFRCLLELARDHLQDDLLSMHKISISNYLVLHCITKSKTQLLEIMVSLGITFPDNALDRAVKYGNVATYALVKQTRDSKVDYKALTSTAIKHENWEVAKALILDMKKPGISD